MQILAINENQVDRSTSLIIAGEFQRKDGYSYERTSIAEAIHFADTIGVFKGELIRGIVRKLEAFVFAFHL